MIYDLRCYFCLDLFQGLRDSDLARRGYQPFGTSATVRTGPPEPPAIFIGRAMQHPESLSQSREIPSHKR
jgi:hypothetical protein